MVVNQKTNHVNGCDRSTAWFQNLARIVNCPCDFGASLTQSFSPFTCKVLVSLEPWRLLCGQGKGLQVSGWQAGDSAEMLAVLNNQPWPSERHSHCWDLHGGGRTWHTPWAVKIWIEDFECQKRLLETGSDLCICHTDTKRELYFRVSNLWNIFLIANNLNCKVKISVLVMEKKKSGSLFWLSCYPSITDSSAFHIFLFHAWFFSLTMKCG